MRILTNTIAAVGLVAALGLSTSTGFAQAPAQGGQQGRGGHFDNQQHSQSYSAFAAAPRGAVRAAPSSRMRDWNSPAD